MRCCSVWEGLLPCSWQNDTWPKKSSLFSHGLSPVCLFSSFCAFFIFAVFIGTAICPLW